MPEIVGRSGHEKVPTQRKTGSEATRKTTRREDRRSCGKHFWTPTVTRFNDTSRRWRSNCSTNNFQTPCRSNILNPSALPCTPFNSGTSTTASTVVPSQINGNVTDWQKIVFSEEYRFVLGTDDNRIRVWRRPGRAVHNSPHTVLRHTARTAGVMGHFSNKIMLVRIQQELLKTSHVIFRLFHGRPAPPICPSVEHVWDQLKRQYLRVTLVHDLELAVQDFRPICLRTK
ncbi:transposable element Tcb2 transposase [Trichonephila clavipes]|nr:transposable element Tcb2 transposase [Trichonephila clavipes]